MSEEHICSKCGGSGPFPRQGSRYCAACLAAQKQEWYQRNKNRVRNQQAVYKRGEQHRAWNNTRNKAAHQRRKALLAQGMLVPYSSEQRPFWNASRPRYGMKEGDMPKPRKDAAAYTLYVSEPPDYLHTQAEQSLVFNEETYVYEGRFERRSISVNPALYRKEATQVLHFCSDRLLSCWLFALCFPSYWSGKHHGRTLLRQAVKEGKRIDYREAIADEFSSSAEIHPKSP